MTRIDTNKIKVLGHLFEVQVKINDIKLSSGWKHWSPTAKEAILILEEMLNKIQEAVRIDGNVIFELVTYTQEVLGGDFFEMTDRMTPQEPKTLDGYVDGLADQQPE